MYILVKYRQYVSKKDGKKKTMITYIEHGIPRIYIGTPRREDAKKFDTRGGASNFRYKIGLVSKYWKIEKL